MADYMNELHNNNLIRAYEIYEILPSFAMDFFEYQKSTNKSSGTILNYAYDMHIFFNYLLDINKGILTLKNITLEDLESLNEEDINEYLTYLKYEKHIASNACCKSLSVLRSFYKYYMSTNDIKNNPAAYCPMPRKEEKKQPKLTKNELTQLLNKAKDSEGLTDTQKKYTKRSSLRDEVILALLGSTGIRVSELCNINLSDIDFNKRSIWISRKGDKDKQISFDQQLEGKIKEYIEYERKPLVDDEEALFVSSRTSNRGRLTAKSVQRIVKKYASTVTDQKITPHSLRRTYGTMLYQKQNDIKLVANALGHKNLQVIKDSYTDTEEDDYK